MRAESTVGVVVFEGFEELDAVGPYDVLQTAAREGAPVTTELLVVDETDLVTASKGLRVEPDGVLAVADADAPDVPSSSPVAGGTAARRAAPGPRRSGASSPTASPRATSRERPSRRSVPAG